MGPTHPNGSADPDQISLRLNTKLRWGHLLDILLDTFLGLVSTTQVQAFGFMRGQIWYYVRMVRNILPVITAAGVEHLAKKASSVRECSNQFLIQGPLIGNVNFVVCYESRVLMSCIVPSESQGVLGEKPAEELKPPPPSEMGPRVKIGHRTKW
jgi:hypothetical protein